MILQGRILYVTKRRISVPRKEMPVKRLPEADGALLVRTDFSDNTAWEQVCASKERRRSVQVRKGDIPHIHRMWDAYS